LTLLLPSGTPIGLIASQSFSEPLTQMQLNKFHHSGEESNLTTGVDRVKEILNCTKLIHTPSMTIYAEDGVAMDICSLLEITLRRSIETWRDLDDRGIHFTLNRPFLLKHQMTPSAIATVMTTYIPTNDKLGRLQKLESTLDSDLSSGHWFLRIWTSSMTDPLSIRDWYKQISRLDPLIRGIRGIKDYYTTTREISVYDPVRHMMNKQEREVLITSGSNLSEVIQLPWVNIQYTTTNDIMELFNEYGIDAACKTIEDELTTVMINNSASVLRKYIRIIATSMCRTGVPCALTFAGMSQAAVSVLKLATFERTLDSFIGAGVSGHTDQLNGISESIMVGKPVPVGTYGHIDLIYPCPQPTDCEYSVSMQTIGDTTQSLPMPIDVLTTMSKYPLERIAFHPPEKAATPSSMSRIIKKRRRSTKNNAITTTSVTREIEWDKDYTFPVDSSGGLLPYTKEEL